MTTPTTSPARPATKGETTEIWTHGSIGEVSVGDRVRIVTREIPMGRAVIVKQFAERDENGTHVARNASARTPFGHRCTPANAA